MKECNKEYIYLKTSCRPIFYIKLYVTDMYEEEGSEKTFWMFCYNYHKR